MEIPLYLSAALVLGLVGATAAQDFGADPSATIQAMQGMKGLPQTLDSNEGTITVAHISDPHLGYANPGLGIKDAAELTKRLQTAVDEAVKTYHVDAIIVSGDIAEPGDKQNAFWTTARGILENRGVPVIYVPGNHDDSGAGNPNNISPYPGSSEAFAGFFGMGGKHYFCVKDVAFLTIDSQLLGNFDGFFSESPQTLPGGSSELDWLKALNRDNILCDVESKTGGKVSKKASAVIAVQHVPPAANKGGPPDARPYWLIQGQNAAAELAALNSLGVKDMLAGHWHKRAVYSIGRITYHIAPSIGYTVKQGDKAPWANWPKGSNQQAVWDAGTGFAIETIDRSGNVQTQFVDVP